MRRVGLNAFAFLALTGVLVAGAATASPARTFSVYLLRGEQLAAVPRQGSSPEEAVRKLVAGPTSAERKRSFRTYIPAGTQLNALNVADGVATVDLGARFFSGVSSRRSNS
jgi:spore germination protein GerM